MVGQVKITADQIAQYKRDGAICLRGLFDNEWVERLRKDVEELLHASGKTKYPYFSHFEQLMWRSNLAFESFIRESPSAAIAKALMESKQVQLYFDAVFIKEPGEIAPSPWHHDVPFWPVDGDQVCSIWLALDPVTKQSSGLEYVAGSHRWGKRFRPPDGSTAPGFDDDHLVMPDIDANRDLYRILNWDMQPGDCLVHHGLTVHGSGGNTSLATRRRAVATRWIGDDATYRAGGGNAVLQVDGLKTGDRLPEKLFPRIAVD